MPHNGGVARAHPGGALHPPPSFPHRWPYDGYPYYAPLIGAFPSVARAPCVPQPATPAPADPQGFAEGAPNFGTCRCARGSAVRGATDDMYARMHVATETPKGSCAAGFDPVCSTDGFCTCAAGAEGAAGPSTVGELLRSDVRAGCGTTEDSPCCP